MLLKASKTSGMVPHVKKSICRKSLFPAQNGVHSTQYFALIAKIDISLSAEMTRSMILSDRGRIAQIIWLLLQLKNSPLYRYYIVEVVKFLTASQRKTGTRTTSERARSAHSFAASGLVISF